MLLFKFKVCEKLKENYNEIDISDVDMPKQKESSQSGRIYLKKLINFT